MKTLFKQIQTKSCNNQRNTLTPPSGVGGLIYLFFGTLIVLFATSCSHNQETKPQRKDIVDAVFASGFIANNDEYLVISAADGYLNKSLVKEGDKVTSGMSLFLLSNEVQSAQYATANANYSDAKSKNDANSAQIQQLKIQISQAKNQLQNDETNYNRYANLIKTNAVSQVDFDKIKLQYESSKSNVSILEKSLSDLKRQLSLNETNALEQLKIQQRNNKDFNITANSNGFIINVNKKQGEFVKRGEIVAKIGAGNPIIKLYVAEEDISRLKLNNKVVVSLNTEKQKTYNATVSRIYPGFDSNNQSFIVEATFTQLTENIMYNTQLQANIVTDEKKNALIIPSNYLLNGDSVLLKEGKKASVQKGIVNNEWVEILSGLTENQTIVISKKQ
jgi:multidrug efflux pump subunit AcrA (membrane-fusion protein)